MSGHHVTYACNCLNVKIQLANKYYLDRHEQYRKSKFTRIQGLALSGWQFELSMEGVVVEYPSLIKVRRIMNNSAGWITVNCHNCSTGDVYSVIRPYARATTSLLELAKLHQFGDHVLIHQGAIFGHQIDNVQKKGIYSTTFRIVLNPDLPVEHVSLENEDEIYDPELQRQLKQIQERLKQSLIDLEEKTEQKIQAYHKEQEILLIQEKEKAIYDGAILWQTMKEVSKTIYAEEQRAYRLSCNKTSTDQVILDRVKRVEQRNHAIEDGSQDALEIRESHVHFAHESAFLDDHPLQRRRSSAFKRDLFGGLAPTAYNNNRRSSYVLDESAIANSFKNSEPMPQQFHRRRSSLVPSNAMPRHHLSHLHPFVKHNNAKSNSSSSWEDAEEDIGSKSNNKSKELNDDDNEDLFPLDEDVESLINYTYGSEERRPSSKYIEFDDDEEEDLTRVRLGEDVEVTTNFATSVPITITHSPAFAARNEIHHNMQKLPSCSSFIEPAYLVNTSKGPSFVGFDYAETDRRASSVFPPLNKEKKRISTRLSSSYFESLNNDTRRLSSSKNRIQLELEQDEDVNHGPMIPPHIFAANTVTDETEALFGSIPRTSIRNRPVE